MSHCSTAIVTRHDTTADVRIVVQSVGQIDIAASDRVKPSLMITRRTFLGGAAASLAGAAFFSRQLFAQTAPTTAASGAQRYRIAASDWMMLKRQKPGALQLAKDCGLDGVEVDMGPLGQRPTFENNLVDEKFRDD